AWCLLEERNPKDVVNSGTMYLVHVLTIYGKIKDLRSQPTRTPAQQQELQELEEGPGSPHLVGACNLVRDVCADASYRCSLIGVMACLQRISALKQLHAGLQKAYRKACQEALVPQAVDLLGVAVYKKTYHELVRRVMGGDKICDPSLLDICEAGTLLSREDMDGMMSTTLAVKTNEAATRRCLALLLWTGVARGDSIRQCKVHGISAKPVKSIGPSACVKFTINYRSGKTTVAGSMDHISFVRSHDIHMCPVHALGVYYHHRFTMRHAPLYLDTPLLFTQVPLIAGHKSLQSMQYDGMRDMVKQLFVEFGLEPAAITHAFRKGGAMDLALSGVDAGQIKSHCHWGRRDVSEAHYLNAESRLEPLLAVGGWDFSIQNRKAAFWHPRYEVILLGPFLDEAAVHIFSFLPALKEANDSATITKKIKACFAALLAALLELTVVLCQDCIWLQLTAPDQQEEEQQLGSTALPPACWAPGLQQQQQEEEQQLGSTALPPACWAPGLQQQQQEEEQQLGSTALPPAYWAPGLQQQQQEEEQQLGSTALPLACWAPGLQQQQQQQQEQQLGSTALPLACGAPGLHQQEEQQLGRTALPLACGAPGLHQQQEQQLGSIALPLACGAPGLQQQQQQEEQLLGSTALPLAC
ncbi:hypothetical protein QJQ45_017888, partial [Haematococcus lacustris]